MQLIVGQDAPIYQGYECKSRAEFAPESFTLDALLFISWVRRQYSAVTFDMHGLCGVGPSLLFFLFGFLGAGGLLILSCRFQQFFGPSGDLADQFLGMGPAGQGGVAGGFLSLLRGLISNTCFAATSPKRYSCGVFLRHRGTFYHAFNCENAKRSAT
jgi:hypothetical protein